MDTSLQIESRAVAELINRGSDKILIFGPDALTESEYQTTVL